MKSYKVKTEVGTFTRKSDRTYTHIIVCRLTGTELQRKVSYAQRNVDYIREVIETRPVDADGFHRTGPMVQGYNQKSLEQAIAILEQAKRNDYFAATWCGRPDLAVKQEAQYLKRPDLWADVHIVEVR